MVEYAILIARNATSIVPSDIVSWLSQLHWGTLGYVALALVTLRFAVWAFRPRH
jgi:hypothetical protein